MSSAVITVLLLGIMLLIIASLIFSALHERHRHKQALASVGRVPMHLLDSRVTMILHVHDGVVVNVEKPEPAPTFTLSSSWYARRRTLVSVCFLLMLFLGLFM